MLSAFYVCCIYSNAVQINFIMEANTLNADQTAKRISTAQRLSKLVELRLGIKGLLASGVTVLCP